MDVTKEKEEFVSKNEVKNTGKGQNRVYFSENSEKFVPGSFGAFAETDNGYRVISIQHPIEGKFVRIEGKFVRIEGKFVRIEGNRFRKSNSKILYRW